MIDNADDLKRTAEAMRKAGDAMAETLDNLSDMIESDGGDMKAQRELTKYWRDAKDGQSKQLPIIWADRRDDGEYASPDHWVDQMMLAHRLF